MSAPPTLFYTIGVRPTDGRKTQLVSRSIPYTSFNTALEFIGNALVTPPLEAFIPDETPQEE